MRKIRRELANHGLSGYICLGILELVQMPGTEPRTLFVDALTRGAQIAYHLGRRLQLELESPHSPVMQLAHGLKRIKTGVPVPGYEALLISAGSPPVEARLMARAIHLCGERVAQENRVEEGNPMSRDVGPGRPPKGSRFRKGESGNPKGRPRKPKQRARLNIHFKPVLSHR